MTLSIVWLRTVGRTEELVFASDSRLRSGQAWDCCPKIMSLPRDDCLISFAGSTDQAYPFMLQMMRAVEFYPASLRRQTDIAVAKGHTLRVFNQMWNLVHDLPVGSDKPDDPEAAFLFGGYSWRRREFLIWQLHFDAEIASYTFRPIHIWPGQQGRKMIAYAGDEVAEAKTRVLELLQERGKAGSGGFDMEPFEVLRDMIRSKEYPTIGGAPQVAKVYRYMHTQHFAVRWPDSSGVPHILGRPALDYEQFDAPIIDPDNLGKHSLDQLKWLAQVSPSEDEGDSETLSAEDPH